MFEIIYEQKILTREKLRFANLAVKAHDDENEINLSQAKFGENSSACSRIVPVSVTSSFKDVSVTAQRICHANEILIRK